MIYYPIQLNYEKIYNKKPLSKEPFDDTVAKKDRIYIEKRTSWLINRSKELNIKLSPYAYSRTPPIDIFEEADTYVKNNVSLWKEEAIKTATKKLNKLI